MNMIRVKRGTKGPSQHLAGFGGHDKNRPASRLGIQDGLFQSLLRDILNDFIDGQGYGMSRKRLRLALAFGNDDSSQRIPLQHHTTHLAPQMLIIPIFEPFKTLTVDSRKSQHVRQ